MSAIQIPEGALARQPKKRWTRFILPTYTAGVILYITLPIIVMIVYSFNQTLSGSGVAPRVKTKWQGFTLQWYRHVFDIPDLTHSLKNSLMIALLSAIIATAIGTLIGLALARYRYRGRATTDFVLFLNISAPEIVMGASLAAFFVSIGLTRGLFTLLLSHVMFSIAYVAVTVRARVSGLDRSLENAAQDLGAGPLTTFMKVTFPLIFPAVIAGGLLAFALSIDDFVITQFVQGPAVMFPTWVLGASRVGIPPQAFVMATLIFAGGLTIAIVGAIAQRRRPV